MCPKRACEQFRESKRAHDLLIFCSSRSGEPCTPPTWQHMAVLASIWNVRGLMRAFPLYTLQWRYKRVCIRCLSTFYCFAVQSSSLAPLGFREDPGIWSYYATLLGSRAGNIIALVVTVMVSLCLGRLRTPLYKTKAPCA